jgi:hypothetical protein
MLTELRAENYKSFRDFARLPLRQITVLLGRNNSGKTAIVRLPLLILSALAEPQRSVGSPVPLRVRGLVYGSSSQELAYGSLPHSPFKLGATLKPEQDDPLRIDFSVQQRQSLRSGQSAFVSEFAAAPDIRPIRWKRTYTPDAAEIHYDDPAVTSFNGVLPRFSENTPGVAKAIRVARLASDELHRTVHIRSIRAPVRAIFESRPILDMGEPGGTEAPYILYMNGNLLSDVAGWYERALGIPGWATSRSQCISSA